MFATDTLDINPKCSI